MPISMRQVCNSNTSSDRTPLSGFQNDGTLTETTSS